MGNGLSSGPKKVAQNLGLLAQNWLGKSTVANVPYCGSDWKSILACSACHGSDLGSR